MGQHLVDERFVEVIETLARDMTEFGQHTQDRTLAKVLIIEDDELYLNALSNFLQDAGHTLFVTADGPQGIKFFQEMCPKLYSLTSGYPR